MSEMSAALGTGGGNHTITWRDRTISAKPITIGILEQYSKWLYGRDKDLLKEDKAELGREVYIKRLDEIREQWKDGHYGMDRDWVQKTIQSLEAGLTLISLVTGMDRDDAGAMMMELPEETAHMLATLKTEGLPSRPKAKAA
jgi:hypothetical protein